MNLVKSNAFHSLIYKASRILDFYATTIDHILSNKTHFKVYPAVLQCLISDNYAILCAISKLACTSFITVSNNYFDLKQFDPEKFCDKLQATLENKFVNKKVEATFEFNVFTSTASEII